MLAFGVMPDVSREDEYNKRCNVSPDVVIHGNGLLIEPIAVCAPSAHTSGDNWYEVKLRTEFLAHPLTPGAVTMMPSSFHVTSRENLYGILEDGIVPGGGSGRIVTFFHSFAPWDPRSYKLAKGRNIDGEKAAFYLPTQTLMEELKGRILDSGQPVTAQTIPFGKIWHRLIVPSGPEQLIRTVHRPWQYEGRDQVVQEARICAGNVDEVDAEAAEIIDIVAAFEKQNHSTWRRRREGRPIM